MTLLSTVGPRFWSKLKVNKNTQCWVWKGQKNKKGYGKFQIGRKNCLAHRVAYEMIKGIIPDGMTVDHLCENKSCVNPTHLEPVSSRVNSRRSKNTIAYINADKTHCPKGHPYFGKNLVVSNNGYNGARRCRTCKNEQERKRDNEKRRAEQLLRKS